MFESQCDLFMKCNIMMCEPGSCWVGAQVSQKLVGAEAADEERNSQT